MSLPRPVFAEGGEVIAVDFSSLFRGGIFAWQTAEELGLALMRYLGHADACLTSAGSDGGIDVSARDACCQVKHRASPAGRQDLQRLVGAATGRSAVFLAQSYSAHAAAWAGAGNVALFTYDQSALVRAENGRAIILATLPGHAPLDERQASISKRLERTTVWIGIISARLADLERSRGRMSVRELRKAGKTATAAMGKVRRSYAAMGKGSDRGRIEEVERSLADIEHELRQAAAALKFHLPE